jgi:hypothetical protein
MSSMSTGDVETNRQRRRAVMPLVIAVISLVACVLAAGAEQLCRFTLGPLKVSHVGLVLPTAILFGGVLSLFIIGPFQLLIVLFGRWQRLKAKTTSLLMLIPTVYIVYGTIRTAISYRNPTPASEIKRFEGITGVPWPTDAKMVLAEHGWGLQDRRHLWLFEGTPQQFDKLVSARGWVLETPGFEDISKWMPVEKAIRCFSNDPAWSAHEVYYLEFRSEDVKSGSWGPGYLITDKEHKRWCVWWDAI